MRGGTQVAESEAFLQTHLGHRREGESCQNDNPSRAGEAITGGRVFLRPSWRTSPSSAPGWSVSGWRGARARCRRLRHGRAARRARWREGAVGGRHRQRSGNGDGPEHALPRNIVAAFAEYERALIRARTRAALAVKRARSERVGQDAVRERRGRGWQAGARREGAGTGRAHQGASRPPAHHQEHRSDAEPGWRSGAGRTLARDDRRPPAASRCLECTHPEARDGRPDRPRRPAEQPHQPPGPPVAHDEVLRFGVDPAFPAERRSPTR